MSVERDRKYMKRALALARKGLGATSPNPAVGCVIVRDDRIVGEGWHKRAGGHHAEVHALEAAGDAARGADVYVTLEPCCHTGKTPPCTEALIRAGVKRVVAAMPDPNPLVAGRGLKQLRLAGIAAESGLMADECAAINRPFIKHVTSGRPYVLFKCAMTMDGRIATVTGESRWISCDASRKMVHRMRSRCDAVMVGVDTIIADNPQLNVRHVQGRNPLRVIVDSRLRTPESVAVLGGRLARKTIIATAESNPRIHLRYTSQGATVLVCREEAGRVSISDLLVRLGAMGIQSILLEGGSRLAGEMVREGLIDEFVFFIAPKIIGSDGFAPFSIQGLTGMERAIPLRFSSFSRSGTDIVVNAFPEAPCLPA